MEGEVARFVGTRENLEQHGEGGRPILDSVDCEGYAGRIDYSGKGCVEHLVWWTCTSDTRVKRHFQEVNYCLLPDEKYSHTQIVLKQLSAICNWRG